MDLTPFLPVIAITFFGFVALAFLLLAPVYLFLDREERASQHWTEDAIARRMNADRASGAAAGNGSTSGPGQTPL